MSAAMMSVGMPDREKPATKEVGPYKMRTIARLTDYSPAVLRAWERRHGLLEPLRGPGGHRLYTDDDLRVLMRVRELMQRGRSIGEIAGVGRKKLLEQRSSTPTPQIAPAPTPKPGPELQNELDRLQSALVDHALALDAGRFNQTLDHVFAIVSADTAVFAVIKPAAERLGDLWFQGKCSVASEHLASGIFVHRLRRLLELSESASSAYAPVVVACFPDEYHQLGALMVAYRLSCQGAKVNFLGAALPFEDLDQACNVLEPAAVLLSVTRKDVYAVHRKALAALLQRRARSLEFVVGGQGAPSKDELITRTGALLAEGTGRPNGAVDRILARARTERVLAGA